MRIFLFCTILLFLTSNAFSNVGTFVHPDSIVLKGKGAYGDEYSLAFILGASTKGLVLDKIELTMVYGKYSSKDMALDGIYDPLITSVYGTNDSGVFGSYYTFIVEYGENLSCGHRMKLVIKQPFEKDAVYLELNKHNPCDENT